MNHPHLVFAETSPYEGIEAIIEQDDEVAFFYLRSLTNDTVGMKSCWIRNLIDAPEALDRSRLESGNAPVLPAKFCASAKAKPRLNEKQLRVVWFAGGDGAALLEKDEVLAIIPPWSGSEGFQGYARECHIKSPFCWPLPDHPALYERIQKSDEFWNSWGGDDSPWNRCEPKLLEAYEKIFGPVVNYFSIDGGQWPPKTLAQFNWENLLVVLTVGVSSCPQPLVEMRFDVPDRHRRIEFAACFTSDAPASLVTSFCQYMGGQSKLPWSNQSCFSHGHTISCDLFLKSQLLPDFSSVLLGSQAELPVTQIELPKLEGDPLNLLWMIPVFENERKYLQETHNFSLINQIICDFPVPVISNRAMVV
jgi:hypothetical protein